MLAEYALVPDIFDSACYSGAGLCDVHLQNLKEPLLNEAIVRDLRLGEWSGYVRNMPGLHPRGKELLEKLLKQNRLCRSRANLNQQPADYRQWCQEAVGSHVNEPLTGIMTTNSLAEENNANDKIASIEKLSNAQWWQDRSASVRLVRNTAEYQKHLRLILKYANSLMFIDPYLDPSVRRYREFVELLRAAHHAGPAPYIEIHRVSGKDSGRERVGKGNAYWEKLFSDALGAVVAPLNIHVEIFIWDDFHDRYLITDLIGIQLPNGFDVTTNPHDVTTWTRLGRKDRDDIQREFDPASNKHQLKCRFTIK
jgi:hypothetical protein